MRENNEVLVHHGILGQKWGVRRFQNADGSMTAAGKKRYKTGDGSSTGKRALPFSKEARKQRLAKKLAKKKGKQVEEQKKQEMTVEEKKKQVLESRSAKTLYENAHLFSTNELQNAYNRLNLERNIKNLVPEEVSAGQKYVNRMRTVNSVMDATANVIGTGSRLYDNVAKVYNAFSDNDSDKLPLISGGGGKKNKNKDKGEKGNSDNGNNKQKDKKDNSNNTNYKTVVDKEVWKDADGREHTRITSHKEKEEKPKKEKNKTKSDSK